LPWNSCCWPCSQQAPSGESVWYKAHCGYCDGTDLKGATGPSALGVIRYHIDVEVTDRIRNGSGHKALQISKGERTASDTLRRQDIGGTNPAMAAGGFIGVREFVWGKTGQMVPVATERGSAPQKALKAPHGMVEQWTMNKVAPGPEGSRMPDSGGKKAFVEELRTCCKSVESGKNRSNCGGA
jgi:hypothetical protein